MRARPLLLCLALTGCTTVGPDYRKPSVAVPNGFAERPETSAASDAELASWWKSFGDPQLSSLIDLALAQNLDVQAAAARIREARAHEREAGAHALPEVNADASYARQRISENAIPLPPIGSGSPGAGGFALPGTEFSTFRIGFDASWELDVFGGTKRAIEAANARTGASIWNHRDAQVSVAAEVAKAYVSLRAAQQKLTDARAELERQQRFEHLVGARARGGLVTGQDLAQQRAERAAAAAVIPVLEAEANAEIHALGVLVGATPEALASQLSNPKAIPVAPAIPAGLPSDLLRRRPDIRSAERNLAATTADIGVATADLYPRISLTATPALISTALATLLSWGSRNYSAGPSLVWPLFDAGKRRATVDVRNAQQQVALVQYRKTVLTALQDVEDALSRIDGDRARLADLQQSLAAATRAEQLARTRYRGGLVTYSDVLLAQAKRIKMEDAVVESRGALARDTVSLAKALGGGWPELAQAEAQR